MPVYVEIAVNVPTEADVFHYHLPPDLEDKIEAGHLVEVPFGKRQVQGVILRHIQQPAVPKTRPVSNLLDQHVVLTASQIWLAQHLAKEYLTPLAAWINMMLPPGIGQRADTIYSISERGQQEPQRSQTRGKRLSKFQIRLLKLLKKRGDLRGRQIDRALPRANWRASARALVRKGMLNTESVLPTPSVQPKNVRTVRLYCPPEVAKAELPNLGRANSKALKRRQAIVNYLLREPGPIDVSWVYAESGGNLTDLRTLADKEIVALGESHVWRDPLEAVKFQPSDAPPLTNDQNKCWEKILTEFQQAYSGKTSKPILLHGVTGSGKTEIYMHAVEETIKHGKQAIILVPEIALTPQTVKRFLSRFPGRVGLIHSQLSPGERYDTWRRARTGKIDIVVGPRSALFSPLPDVGLIVLDECHDDSYYQNEPPFYDAGNVAIAYVRHLSAICLFGSATPRIANTFEATQGDWHYLHLPARILAHRETVRAQVENLGLTSRYRPLENLAETMELPPVEIIDMRQELKDGNRSIFSRQMQDDLSQVLKNEQQAILFLNRRGTATYVFCRDCGESLKCPNCDLPLTYHTKNTKPSLLCHRCNYKRRLPKKCPQCKSSRIRHYGTGTERVENEIQKLFPEVRTMRWDYETTRRKGAHEMILNNFAAHRADVLIGTQMLAKGLDLPFVTLVCVVLADVGLNLPDYTAAERTFQVLTQVAGRAGRSPLGGHVVLQTFKPDNYVIQAAAQHSYRAFYKQEIAHRRRLKYPPFTRLVRMEYRHINREQAENTSRKFSNQIKSWIEAQDRHSTEMIGPVPCFFARLRGLYRWQIILRGPNPVSLLRGHRLGDWRVEIDPPSLL